MPWYVFVPLVLTSLTACLALFSSRSLMLAALALLASAWGPWICQQSGLFSPPAILITYACFDGLSALMICGAFVSTRPGFVFRRSLMLLAGTLMIWSAIAHVLFAVGLIPGLYYAGYLCFAATVAALAVLIGITGRWISDGGGYCGDLDLVRRLRLMPSDPQTDDRQP